MQIKNQVKQYVPGRNNEIYDPQTQKIYFISNGDICILNASDQRVVRYPLGQSIEKELKIKQRVLKFKKISNNNSIIFNPSAKSLICKTDKIQEVDLNTNFCQGTHLWKISCTGGCLCLYVGIKNSEKKKQYYFQFILQYLTHLIFKLDVDQKIFQTWIDKPLNIIKKTLNLNCQIMEWTPFIRVKGIGVSIFLNEFVQDPQNIISIYNIFNASHYEIDNTLMLEPCEKYDNNNENYQIKLIDINTILLYSKYEIKLIRRSKDEKQFNFNFNLYSTDGNIAIKFENNQIDMLQNAGLKIKGGGNVYYSKKIKQWVEWMSSAFAFLDTHVVGSKTSKLVYLRAYQILLTKLQALKPYIDVNMKASSVFQSDVESNWGANQSIGVSPKPAFTIPQSIKLNNMPTLKLHKQIKQVHHTKHYLLVCSTQLQRILIINRQNIIYKLTEINIKKGIKKQHELNQYQKELDLFLSTNNNNNQPNIYKILKNCLKYADKIKINQKIIKDNTKDNINNKKSNILDRKNKDKDRKDRKQKKQKKQKKTQQPQINSSQVNILINMGFSQIQSKRAMVIANNNIDKAIQVILATKSNSITQNVNQIILTWSCQFCTFANTDNNATTCSVCNSPRTINITQQTKKLLQKIEEDKISQVSQLTEEQIQSANIQQQLKKIFVWEIGFAYCPLIIVGVFENKLRFRLFGPNPKYYSMFYNKDDEFVDLTHLAIYDAAYKIDQKPVRYQFYNTISKNQQKQSAFGWISIQDEDLQISGFSVQNMMFIQKEITKEKIMFDVKVIGKKNKKQHVELYQGAITIDKIYIDKKKSFVIQHSQVGNQEKIIKQVDSHVQHQQLQERIKINSNIIPKNGYLELFLARKNGKEQTLIIKAEHSQVHDKIHQQKSFLPIIASFEQGSSQVATLNSTLKAGNKPLILKNLNNNIMSVQYVVLQKVGNSPTTSRYKGCIYFSDDVKKIAVNKVMFQLEKGKKKFYIETKKYLPTAFVTVELLPGQQANQSELIEEIALVGLIGQQCKKKKSKNNPKYYDANKEMEVVVRKGSNIVQNKKYKIQTEVMNSIYDINALSEQEIQSLLQKFWKEGESMDLRVLIYGLIQSDLQLDKLHLEGWQIVRSVSHWTRDNKRTILQETYRDMLQKFLSTGDVTLIDILIEEENKRYLKIIEEKKYNVQKFIKKYIIDREIDYQIKKKYRAFFQQISVYLHHCYNNCNFNYLNMLNQAFKSSKINSQNLQLIFQIIKQFEFQKQLVISYLLQNINKINENISKKIDGRLLNKQEVLVSGYGSRSYKDNANSSTTPIQHCRYIVQMGKLYRKYTVQLINLYKINRISLNFEKSKKKTGFTLIIKSFDERGGSKIEYNKNYPQYIWQQLSISPYAQQIDKSLKQSKRSPISNYLILEFDSDIISRFIQIEISFTLYPNIGSEKDIEKCPQNQIIPEIFGQYQGQSMYSLPIFKQIDFNSLIFVKNVGSIKKFHLKSANNIYCYQYSQRPSKVPPQPTLRSFPTQTTKPYLLACVSLDQLISRGGDKYSQSFISTLVNMLPNLERGFLLERIILFLKKVGQSNGELACFLLKNSFNNQHTFNSILRNSSLTSQKLLKILDNQPSAIQTQNIIYYIKSRDDNIKQLMCLLLKRALETKKIEQTIALHERHGWVDETELILDYLIRENKKDMFLGIVGCCHNNCQLVRYGVKLMKERGMDEWFNEVFNEIVKVQRNVTEEEIKQLLKCMINYICNLVEREENYDESEVNESFFILIYIINKLNVRNKQIIELLIHLFSQIANKQQIICKFLTLSQLKKYEYIPKLLSLCLEMLSNYLVIEKNNNCQQLAQVHQILSFICKNQQNHKEWINLINSDILTSLCQVFSAMIIKQVCFGGEQSYKIIDSARRFKLSTIACIASIINKLSSSKSTFISKLKYSDKCNRNIIKWLMLNTSIYISAPQKPNNFIEIELAAWNILLLVPKNVKDKITGVFAEEFEKEEGEISRIKSGVVRKLYERRLFNMGIKYIDKISDQDGMSRLIEFIYQKLIGRLVQKEEKDFQRLHERQKQDLSKVIQKQYANMFEIEGETKNKPKDWLQYKNGAKNSVYKLDYPKGVEKTRQILLKLKQKQIVNLSKIIIGFQQLETPQQSCSIPLEVMVEGGLKPDELKFIGKMIEIPDNHYINYSVRIFGLNCAEIQANRLSSSLNKYPQIKYLKFTFKSPESQCISDVIHANEGNKGKYLGSSINFLSIHGYSQMLEPHSEIQDIQAFIVSITANKHRESLKKVFENIGNVTIFKDSLVSLSRLKKMDNESDDINKFIIQVCELSAEIGNIVLQRYFNMNKQEQLNEKILSEIILLDEGYIQQRIEKLHNFIMMYLKEKKKIYKFIEKYLDKFNKIVYIVQRNRSEHVCNISLVFNILDTTDICTLIKSNAHSIIFYKYICTIMTLSHPFSSSKLDRLLILKTLTEETTELCGWALQALVVSDRSCQEWYISNNYLKVVYERIIKRIKSKNENVVELMQDIQSLGSLCYNKRIKQIINSNKYNIQIFKLMISQQYNIILSKQKNNILREFLSNFISRSVLGTPNERNIAQILKNTLNVNGIDHNQYFVGEVFLPIVNSYEKVAIYMNLFDREKKKILLDMNLKKFKNKVQKNSNNTSINHQIKYRLPTALMNNNSKKQLYELLKVNCKVDGGNFNLKTSHGSSAYGMFNEIAKTLTNTHDSLLILFKASIDCTKSSILGIFYKEQSSVMGARTLPLYWNENCLMFLIKDNQQIKFINCNKQNNNKFISIHDDALYDDFYDDFDNQFGFGQKTLEISFDNMPFCQIYSSNMNGSSYINLNKINGSSSNITYTFQSAQYWLFEPIAGETVPKVENQGVKMLLLSDQLMNLYNNQYFQSQLQTTNMIKLLRTDKIYEFPLKCTIKRLKQSLQLIRCKIKQSEYDKIVFRMLDHKQISNQVVLESLMQKIQNYPILDLLCDGNNLIDIIDYTSQMKSESLAFLPDRTILKHFQEIGGVSEMIKSIKKSLEIWKNKQRKDKWLQYVVQLQNYSKYPYFFGMYLKDNETIDLLFKLLSGLPDKEPDKKWDELQLKSSQRLLKIIIQILNYDKTIQFRQYALKQNFLSSILDRLKNVTGLCKRQYKCVQQQQQQISPSKIVQDDGTKQIKKKKGVGYGNDGSINMKWMKGNIEGDVKKQSEVIQLILSVIDTFIGLKGWKVPKKVLESIYQSALLPYLEDSLRAGTLLEISKNPPKFRLVFKILRTLSKNINLVQILMQINKNYRPKQTQSLQSLTKSLSNTSNIFLSCLKSNKEVTNADKISEELAKDIIQTSKLIQEAIEEFKESYNDQYNESQMKNILQLPFDKKYRLLLRDLRFDYIDMKEGTKIKHHFQSNFIPNYTPNQNKIIRLAQQLADLSTSLPYQHTNSIFVRCDKDRVDFMQALIMGANGTPYGHGAFLYDVYFDDTYPSSPPKVNLTTTGYGKVRFNPNLYACGKVCLSLLGTWRGNASQNWDPKVSTLLQVLVSIQAIIMSEEVFFNQPGFEGEQGTPEGQKKNEAYSNIVRYCNLKFAMIDNLRNPPKGFQTVIKRHFYLKQHEIMQQCKKWLLYAEKRQANYVGLVNDHNTTWCNQFKKSKNQYKDMLQKAIEELEEEFKKLQAPSIHDMVSEKKISKNKSKGKKQNCDLINKLESQNIEEIDVEYDKKDFKGKIIDVNDEKVKDRWSRYIGAMGIDAVNRQSKADILVFGLGPVGLQVVKNLVLSGCRKLTIVDERLVRWEDLSGGFFYTEADVGKRRVESAMYKIKELNMYVKVDTINYGDVNEAVIKSYNLVFVTEMSIKQQYKLNQQCRLNNIKYTSAQLRGVCLRIFNDFGDKFKVLDKNGEQPVEVIIKSISCTKNGVITLIDGSKHSFEDGEPVVIRNVEGMRHKDEGSKSINETIHQIKVINSKSFEIGDTTMYEPYIRNGTVKNIKTSIFVRYRSMSEVFQSVNEKLPIDQNLQYYDFIKEKRNKVIHYCFIALDDFIEKNKRLPNYWNVKDSQQLVEIFGKYYNENMSNQTKQFVKKFGYTAQGYLPPLCAFLGGFVAQEIIKAITQKYKPLDAVFYMDEQQIIPQLPQQSSSITAEKYVSSKQHRDKGFEIVVGKQLLQQIKNSRSFMVGSGAIGCELLKNFAMIGLGTGEKGKITLTDPDHIENSNLNRQFLFREKHISKPKSRTAAASILLMNPQLKGHISALLERVSESTESIFSNKFFSSLSFVANALDNLKARRYVDHRCVQNKIPLFQSGTLGPKGHIQVIIPYKTQSYGSKSDPMQQGQIPHCTLKLFPEQTLHCIEWSRDIFSKKFTLQPKSFMKIKEKTYKPEKDQIKNLNQCIVMASKAPSIFDHCVAYAVKKFYQYFRDDIMQLLYTYPLNAKTKDGEPFWKLPKRPPSPILSFNSKNMLHCTFVTSMAVLIAKIYQVKHPTTFRSEEQRMKIGKQAQKIKIENFVPSDEKSKSILKQTAEDKKESKVEQQQQQKQKEMDKSDHNELELYNKFIQQAKNIEVEPQEFEKDNDQNGHIDFIYSMANLRAINYKLEQMQWINVKLKAGRIVPALATTTTCVAGLQTLQICKYIKKNKIEDMRNSFLNLAVPSLQMSQPGQASKIKLSPQIQVNLWDRWQVPCTDTTTFGEIYDYLQNKYHFHPIGVLQGMSRIDTAKTVEKKKEFLKSKILDRLDKEENYVDIVVLFTKSEMEEKLLENVPPVRLKFDM